MQRIRIQNNSIKSLTKILGFMKVGALALKMGAICRKCRKCDMSEYLRSYWLLLNSGFFSYDAWAQQASSLINSTISAEALRKRIKPATIAFLKKLLENSFRQKLPELFDSKLFCSFAYVYIQDATHFSLPKALAMAFPGSYSSNGQCATAKVQAVFCLTNGIFSNFLINSFRDTDQKDAPRIVEQLVKGDLLIRDQGYFTLPSFKSILEKGAHFLSRLKFGVSVFDLDTGKRINLLKHLKKYGFIDKWVIIGDKTKVECRIVAVKLPNEVAKERRRKAKADRNKKTNHSKGYLALLDYSIFITTVDEKIWCSDDIVKAYRCRWYIEILFKGWKSGLKINFNIPQQYVSKLRAEFFFYSVLLKVNLLIMPVYCHALVRGFKQGRTISILKTCQFIAGRLFQIVRLKRLDELLDQILYHCAYDKRKDRINAIEMMFFETS